MSKTSITILFFSFLAQIQPQPTSSVEALIEKDNAIKDTNDKTVAPTYCSNHCETCNFKVTACSKCGEGYYWDHDYKICALGLIDGCKLYYSKKVCGVCKSGYRNLRGICRACTIPRCGDCNSDVGTCVGCKKGFTFSTANTNGATCDLTCDVPNCLTCFNGNGKFCSACEPGFRRSVSDKCEPCDIVGCEDCQNDKSVCTNGKCREGFYFFNGVCNKCTNGCKSCDLTGRCVICDTGNKFYMDQSLGCVRIKKFKIKFYK